MGKDTHALSGPAQSSALEVLAANGVETIIQRDERRDADARHLARDPRLQPRSRRPLRRRHRHHAVAQSSRGRRLQVQPARRRAGRHRCDALDRGPGERPAQDGNAGVKRVASTAALTAATTHQEDLVLPYVRDLANVVDMDAIRSAAASRWASIRLAAPRFRTGSRSTTSTA